MGANKNLKIIAFVGYMNDETYLFTLWCDSLVLWYYIIVPIIKYKYIKIASSSNLEGRLTNTLVQVWS